MADKLFRPDIVGTNDAWGLFAGADKPSAVDCGDPVNPDQSTGLSSTAINSQDVKPAKDFAEKMSAVATVTIYVMLRTVTGGSSCRFRIVDSLGTHTGSSFSPSSTPTIYSLARTVMSNGSTSWTEAALRHANFALGIDNLNTNWTNCYGLWAVATFTPTITTTMFSRQLISQKLHEFAQRHELMSCELPLQAFDMKLLDDFNFQHPDIPHEDGESRGLENWELSKCRLMGFDYDADKLTLTGHFLNLRSYLALLRDTATSPYEVESATYEPDGPLRLDMGITRTMARSTMGTIMQRPPTIYHADIGFVAEVGNNVERIGPYGTLVEDPRKNFCKNSSFILWNGVPTNWGQVNSPNASQVSGRLFSPDIERGVSDIAYGLNMNPSGAGDNGFNQSTTYTWENDANGVLSIDHEDSSGDALNIIFRRNSDNWYWNPATPAWQSGGISFNLPVSGNTVARDSIPFDMGGYTYTNTFLIGLRAPTASQDVTVYHVQLEGGYATQKYSGIWAPTSRIITYNEASPVERREDLLYLTTQPAEGRRIVHPDRGTFFVKFKVEYDHDDIVDAYDAGTPASVMIVSYAFDGTNHFFDIEYDSDNSRFLFGKRCASVSDNAIKSGALTSGWHVIAARWISSNEEFGLPNHSLDIWVDGVKGDTGTGQAVTESSSDTYFYYGARSVMTGYNRLNGLISDLWSSPVPKSDTEIVSLSNYFLRNTT